MAGRAGAIVGVVMATYQVTGNVRLPQYLDLIDRAFAQLEAGLPLEAE